MCEGYAVLVKDLNKFFGGITDLDKLKSLIGFSCLDKDGYLDRDGNVCNLDDYKKINNELLKYVPVSSNYSDKFHGCDDILNKPCGLCLEKNNDRRVIRNYNNLECYYVSYEYYSDSSASLEEHLKKKHPPLEHSVILSSEIFEKIKHQVDKIHPMIWISSMKLSLGMHYKRCTYDSSKEESCEYKLPIHCIVHFLDSDDPLIQQWLDTVAVKGCAEYDNNNFEKDPESYETLYQSTTFTIRQHLEMYKKDSKQCNYNTVNYGIKYHLLIYQGQYDLLRQAYINDDKLPELFVHMIPVQGTNVVVSIDERWNYLEKDCTWSNANVNRKKKKDQCVML